MKTPLTISLNDFQKWGCPHCGHCIFLSYALIEGVSYCGCEKCENKFVVLDNDVKKSPLGFGKEESGETFYPVLQKHPREGTPKH